MSEDLFSPAGKRVFITGGGARIGRVGRPSDFVGTVLHLAGRSGAFTTGAVIKAAGGSAL